MKIETYFNKIRNVVDSCAYIRLKDITFDKRGTHEGFIRAELSFSDGSTLHLREFIDTETAPPERLMYTYHYTGASGNLIFRYDNTRHHGKLGLPTYPHHKHDGSETNVTASDAPGLAGILREIEMKIRGRD